MRIALFGGSFNPIHNGHLNAIKQILKSGKVDEVWVIPCRNHAFSKGLISSVDRVKMIELAVQDLENVRVDKIELESEETNYTFETVKKLKEMYDHDFSWVIGSDVFREIHLWHKYEELFELVDFILQEREGYPIQEIEGMRVLFELIGGKNSISSSSIRNRVKKEESIEGVVPREVLDYILKNDLYRRIKSVLVVYSEKRTEEHLSVVRGVKNLLGDLEIYSQFVLASDLKKEFFRGVDLIIAIGGDGTFIRASHFTYGQLILGINSDSESSEGGLMSFNEKDYSRILEVFEGNFKIRKKDRIAIRKNGRLKDSYAMNEVFIGARNQFMTSRYVFELDGISEEHRSSGVLVVTPKGSHAWYKSAGGIPYAERVLKYLVREPFVCRLFDSKMLKGEIKDKIKFHSTMLNGGVIALDSNKVYFFNKGDEVELSFAKSPLSIVEGI
ncbi:nicotinate (nicotinamide) nucleotide adenylyltransferase [archaeon]|jgi:nicotinate-nucleotide adenylyltransferase|nr:nicotinate (nicotinamide) nucleotide adenylyltransferase [archaeon]